MINLFYLVESKLLKRRRQMKAISKKFMKEPVKMKNEYDTAWRKLDTSVRDSVSREEKTGGNPKGRFVRSKKLRNAKNKREERNFSISINSRKPGKVFKTKGNHFKDD